MAILGEPLGKVTWYYRHDRRLSSPTRKDARGFHPPAGTIAAEAGAMITHTTEGRNTGHITTRTLMEQTCRLMGTLASKRDGNAKGYPLPQHRRYRTGVLAPMPLLIKWVQWLIQMFSDGCNDQSKPISILHKKEERGNASKVVIHKVFDQ